jgi:hypothetical protein
MIQQILYVNPNPIQWSGFFVACICRERGSERFWNDLSAILMTEIFSRLGR